MTTNELRLRCFYCKDYTQSISPVIIKKEKGNRIHIRATCIICNKQKSKYLNKYQVDVLPDKIRDSEDNTTFVDNIKAKTGGIVPVIPIIAAICAGITALSTAGGAAAGTIIAAKNSSETERHNKKLEQIADGNSTEGGSLAVIVPLLHAIYKSINKENNERSLTDRALPVERSMTDDELTQRSVAYLTGKGFQISYN